MAATGSAGGAVGQAIREGAKVCAEENKRHGGGRRLGYELKLTPERQRQILLVLSQGNYRDVAAALSGTSMQTFNKWLKKAEPEIGGHLADYPKYVAFKNCVLEAEAEAERLLVENWHRQGQHDWQAGAAFLGRKHRQKWAADPKVMLTSEDATAIAAQIRTAIQQIDAQVPPPPTE